MPLPSSDEHFRRLIESGNDLLMIAAPDLGVTYVSPSVERLLGYRPDEMVGRHPADLLHPDDVPVLFGVLGEALADPEAVRQLTWRIRHRDGSWRVMEALTRMLAPDDPAAGFLVNARDVTERQAVEEALRQSEERYRAVVESLNEVVFHSDAQGRWTFLNRAWSDITGLSVEESVGRTFLDFAHPDDLPHCYQTYQLLLSGERESVRHDVRFRHRDGGWRQIEVFVRAMRDAGGAMVGTTGTLNDVTERRAADAALRASEARFRSLVENAQDIIVVLDPATGRPTYQSPSMQRVLGYAPEELAGQNVFALVHPDDAAQAMAEVAQAVAQPGATRHAEYRYRHRDGSWRHLETYGRTLSPTSAAEGVVFNTRDVTERRRAEEALRASEEHFRRLIENGSDLLMISRADGPLTYVSPSAERLLGYRPEELLGKVPNDLTHPDDVDGVWEGLRRVAEAPGSVHPIALRLRHKDGSWRALEALARTVSPHSADEGIVANSRDVTAQRAAERALQESEAKYRSVVDAAQDMITVIDAGGIVQFQSPSAARIVGFAPEEMVGRNVMEFLHPDDVPMAVERLGKVVTNPGTVECVQYRSLCKDGSYRYVESTGRTVLPDSAAAGAVGIVRDITARIEAEAALRQARADAERAHAEAERANRAKSEFLSRMSHELRTPLNSILGFAQLLEGVGLEPDYQTGVGYILAGGRHLLALIDEVLDISRIEAGEHVMSLEPVRVLDVVREAVDLVRPLAAARGVRVVEAVGAHAAAYVRADRQRLTQVLLNLLSNAVKYNRPGGEVRVDAAAEATSSADPAGRGRERVRVRVRDEGAGLTPEQQAQLFVPFARLGAERTEVEGTGLGLALSRGLAQAMGGALFLEASGPDGSVFSVDLAAAPDPLTAAPAAPMAGVEASTAAVRPAALLYIEDNAANLRLVEAVLRSHPGWHVIPAPDGGRGLALAAEHRPDLVLLDLHLPDMHGSEVLRGLRADPRTANTPVVVVSADATPRAAETLAAQGADAFLTKPLDVRLFAQTVERLLRERPLAVPPPPSPAGRTA